MGKRMTIRDKQEQKERKAARQATESPTPVEEQVVGVDNVDDEATKTTPAVSFEPPILGNEDMKIIVALPSTVRPSVSTLSQHKDREVSTQKRFDSDIDKDKATSDGNARKKQKHVAPSSDPVVADPVSASFRLDGTEPICNDASTSAALFFNVDVLVIVCLLLIP